LTVSSINRSLSRADPACKKTSQRPKNQNPAGVRNFILVLACSSLGLCGAAPGTGLPWPLPVVNGTLSGNFRLSPQSPALAWRAEVRPAGEGALAVAVSVDSSGGRIRAHATISGATGDGEWQLDEGRVDFAPWFAAVTEKWPLLAGWQASGTLALTGHGTLRSGVFDGTVALALENGGMRNDAKKISCEGISLRLALAGLQPLRTGPGQEFGVTRITGAGAELHDLKISFALAPGNEVRVASAETAGFGGKISIDPFVFNPAQPRLTLAGHAVDVDLAQIFASIDPEQLHIEEAVGRVSGRITLHIDANDVRLGQGGLVMRQGETARLVFAPTPGLFTPYIPQQVRKYYPGFESIELRRLPLVMKTFRIRFYPDGEQAERSVLIQFEGNSADPHLPAPISEEININGPLRESIQAFQTMRKAFK